MRAFISIDMPEEVRQKIIKIQSQLPDFRGKKTERENLHLTLKFLGEVDGKKVEKIKKNLREIKFKKLDCEINEIGVFSSDFIKIVWLHLAGCEELQREIDKNLMNLFEKENRFMSHLTIARVKNIRNRKEFLKEINKIKIEPKSFIVDNFRLKQSVLEKQGPKYETIEEYKLKI